MQGDSPGFVPGSRLRQSPPRYSGGGGAGPRGNIPEGPAAFYPGVGRGRVYTAASRAVEVDFQVVEAASLLASHDREMRANSLLKTGRTARKTYRTRDETKADVFDYIESFYNPKRRHSKLGYVISMEFENQRRLV